MSKNTNALAVVAAPGSSPKRNRGPVDQAAKAVAQCRAAWYAARDAYFSQNPGITRSVLRYDADKKAAAAYRDALPSFSSRENIRCFIACVTYGILFDAVPERLSGTLLYAAQVALASLPHEPRPTRRPKK
jgi:hypothetical protein